MTKKNIKEPEDEFIVDVRKRGITEIDFERETRERLLKVMVDMHTIGNAAKGWTPDRTHKALYNALKSVIK